MPRKKVKPGKVYLIGAGPGDPDLITVKGFSLLNSCDLVVYDNLIPHELIITLPESIEKIYVGKQADAHTLPQDEINKLLVKHAKAGHNVARLKGGDPFVFGRGGEEAEYLQENGIEFEVVPGVTSGLAAAASAGIPASHRDLSSAILLITAHGSSNHEFFMDWDWVSQINNGTVIGYMGVKQLPNVVKNMIEKGMPADIPAALVERCCFSTQKVVRAKLSDLPQKAIEANINPPAIFIIGEVAGMAEKLNWYDKKPMSGVRVMVTRPADQSRWVYQMFRNLGAEVLACPTIRTSFVGDMEAWEKFRTLNSENRWLLFSSENGVRYFFGYIRSRRIDMRMIGGYKIAATGFGTLRTLQALGYIPDFSPALTGTKAFSRRMAEEIDLKRAQIIRVRGKLEHDPVEEILGSAGAEIIPMCAYDTFYNELSETDLKRLDKYPPHVIMFTSGRSVDGFVENMGEEKAREMAAASKIATIGPTTTRDVEKYGMEVAIEASRHSIPDLINQISQYFAKKG